MKHTKAKSMENFSGSGSYSIRTGQTCKLHVAFMLDHMDGGGASLKISVARASGITMSQAILRFSRIKCSI